MADYTDQVCMGLFKRPHCNSLRWLYLLYNLPIVYNILETIVGINGLKFIKPRGDGKGWMVSGQADAGKITSATTDDGTATSPITFVSSVAVDDTDKCKLNIKTKTFTIPTYPSIPDGYEEKTVPVSWQWDSSSHKYQYKTGTVLYKTGTIATTWTDAITFTAFSD